MIFGSRRQLRKRLLLAVAVGIIITLCLLGYSLYLFVHFEGNLLADHSVGKLVEHLSTKEKLTHMDLELEVDPAHSYLRGEARLTLKLLQERTFLLSSLFSFFLPIDLVFFLHPDLHVERIVFGDRTLDFQRIRSLVFVDLKGLVPSDGTVMLDVFYHGRLNSWECGSVLCPSLVYLDPEDNYYPCQPGVPCIMNPKVSLPKALVPVMVQDLPAVSNLAIAGMPEPPQRLDLGSMKFDLYAWGDESERIEKSVRRIHGFLSDWLPKPRMSVIRLLRAPGLLPSPFRYDDTGTVLVPSSLSEGELAFIVTLHWIGTSLPFTGIQEEEGLFTQEEIAQALALQYIHRMQGDHEFRTALQAISDSSSFGLQSYRNPFRQKQQLRHGYGRDSSADGYLLTIVRRKIGDLAFERLLDKTLSMAVETGKACTWEQWTEQVEILTGDDLSWLFKGWAGQRRSVDLAVNDFAVNRESAGWNAKAWVQNRGNQPLLDKVTVLFLTRAGAVQQLVTISQLQSKIQHFDENEVLGIVIDPDMEWFDVDRSNNIVYFQPPAVLLSPSEDNRYLAVAYGKLARTDQYPLMIFQSSNEHLHTFLLDHAVDRMHWINDSRLIVHSKKSRGMADGAPNGAPQYLIDIVSGRVEALPGDVEIAASDSGKYLLINQKHGNIWRHRLKDLDRKLTRNFMNNLPYALEWVPGVDLLTPNYPYDYSGQVKIYSINGDRIYKPFSRSDGRFFAFHGYEEGLAFIREKEGGYFFHILANPKQESTRSLIKFSGKPLGFDISKYGGIVYIKEALNDQMIRIGSFDPTRETHEVLFEGPMDTIYDIFCDKGLLIRKKHVNEGGITCYDIQFEGFGGAEARFITQTPAPERVLALVGNQRYLYFAEEVRSRWSSLESYNHYLFFCYDFLNRETRRLDFITGSP